MVKKKVLTALVVGACIWGGPTLSLENLDFGDAVAEARNKPKIEVMDRELKKNKGYESSDVYRRSHELIYGDDKPARDGRVRIAVVINGDENMVVEDRIKNQVYSHLRKKFPIDYFAVMKGTDINSRLLQYAEDMYYDQREYATTKEREYNHSNSTRGISAKISGVKNIFDSVTDSSHKVTSTDNITGTREGNVYNTYNNDSDLDGDIDNRWYGGGSRSDDYTGTVDRNASGTGHVDTDTDHKGWGASIGFGASTSNSSGDETRVIKSSKVDIDGMAVGANRDEHYTVFGEIVNAYVVE